MSLFDEKGRVIGPTQLLQLQLDETLYQFSLRHTVEVRFERTNHEGSHVPTHRGFGTNLDVLVAIGLPGHATTEIIDLLLRGVRHLLLRGSSLVDQLRNQLSIIGHVGISLGSISLNGATHALAGLHRLHPRR